MKKLLITGISGLIGKAVLIKILAQELPYEITALVRPNTDYERFGEFQEKSETVPLDLADTKDLKEFLDNRSFDTILHIGALRGGRKFPKEVYYRANVMATEQFVEYCLNNNCELLFCSSVGVFGAIPDELPANNETERNPDNYYHYTKIQSERIINKAVLQGLRAAILRPSITYGRGDYGFPWQLVKMVDKRIFPMINKRTWIHLCDIETISDAFIWLLCNDYPNAISLNVADREPVQLADLVNFISRQLRNKNYIQWMYFDRKLFAIGEYLAKFVKNELWTSRFELISKSWIYDVRETYQLMGLKERFTIPGIQSIIKAYREE
ncbi:MAG: UDP-glucose 4-epimerase [Candidatus Cloacimonetes bacterium HGW-Cloacimonetes-2]|jgi:nucleoside-diphosphate-sugar epimerase|nr:MAG: UDP-glucose 4-epimerase [Candidatus Cloacimonetes bacterium HGW-Cloacimonetes-2]